ncbi:MAG TPA: serine/threonine-protein kinase [Ktedonobacteraceae bacterium]|nr:serine/threonine-protein kinase [Ktedonobacteraceae bacterium]
MSESPENRLGQQVGSYRLISWLGKGGFADVYLGEHIYLKTQSAIKMLRVQLSEETLKDFLTEARTIAKLEHPHIVRVFDYGIEDENPFLVMSYAPNGSLQQRFPKGTYVPMEKIVPIVQQIASALDYAHQQRLIHRDVKPENMLLGSQDQVLLSDFGVVVVDQSSNPQTAKKQPPIWPRSSYKARLVLLVISTLLGS